jgi:hypothetical protein
MACRRGPGLSMAVARCHRSPGCIAPCTKHQAPSTHWGGFGLLRGEDRATSSRTPNRENWSPCILLLPSSATTPPLLPPLLHHSCQRSCHRPRRPREIALMRDGDDVAVSPAAGEPWPPPPAKSRCREQPASRQPGLRALSALFSPTRRQGPAVYVPGDLSA